MPFQDLVTDALGHVGGGVVIALADHVLYRAANPAAARIERKREVLTAIETILDAQPALAGKTPPVDSGSRPYADAIDDVRSHLVEAGRLRDQGGFQRLLGSLRTLARRERINCLGPMGKLGVATVFEVLYDTGFWMDFYTHEWQMSPIAAFSTNLYQIPCFWLGLVVGGGMSAGLRRLFRPGDERRLDAVLEDLLRETPVVELVLGYEAPAVAGDEPETSGAAVRAARLTRAGRRFLASVDKGARQLSAGEGRKHEESEIESVRRRYQEIRERYRKG